MAEVVAVFAGELGKEVEKGVEVGPQMQQREDEATGEDHLCGGGHGYVRGGVHGVRGDVHDDVRACVGAYESLRDHESQPSGCLLHPVGLTRCSELPREPHRHRHTRRNGGDHLATRDHGRDERVVRTLPLNELPCQ